MGYPHVAGPAPGEAAWPALRAVKGGIDQLADGTLSIEFPVRLRVAPAEVERMTLATASDGMLKVELSIKAAEGRPAQVAHLRFPPEYEGALRRLRDRIATVAAAAAGATATAATAAFDPAPAGADTVYTNPYAVDEALGPAGSVLPVEPVGPGVDYAAPAPVEGRADAAGVGPEGGSPAPAEVPRAGPLPRPTRVLPVLDVELTLDDEEWVSFAPLAATFDLIARATARTPDGGAR